ncbi:hypothetical protein FRC06_005167, partial [Ceratobasidium sp. 370]
MFANIRLPFLFFNIIFTLSTVVPTKTPTIHNALKRNCTESSRSKEANANKAAVGEACTQKKREKQARQQRLEEEEEDLLVEHESETEREAQLRERALAFEALSSDLQRELDRTRALLLKKRGNTEEDSEPVPWPQVLTGFTVNEFRQLIGLPQDLNDIDVEHRWLVILASVRDFMTKSGLDWESALKINAAN